MLLSMTGQGAASATANGVTVTVEMRAVNNRHLKINLRSPDSLITLESLVEKQIRACVGRGTINVNIKVQKETRADDFAIDTALLNSYRSQLQEEAKVEVPLSALLALPGVVRSSDNLSPQATHSDLIVETVAEALEHFNRMRTTEGEALGHDLTTQLQNLALLIQSIRERAPTVVANYSARLTDKLNQLLEKHNVKLNDTDLIREIGVFADRCDITEEVVRLDSHIAQFNEVMHSNTSQGRKLDFITQELFREINTIGSKANDAAIAGFVVEAKTVIERVREQVQNIE